MGARDKPEEGGLVILVTGHSNLQTAYLEAGKTTQVSLSSIGIAGWH